MLTEKIIEKGKLFVIDGADGSGKATQAEMLANAFLRLGHQFEKTDFPRYENNFFGKLLGQFQTSTEFEFSKIHPLLASIPYAADRFESKGYLDGLLSGGINVISDRYVSANQLHQGGKIKDEKEFKEFLERLDYMEYEVFKIPRPNLVILLDVPHQISIELMKQKESKNKKNYSAGKTDRVEEDHEYQLNARESGIKMLANESWIRIQCSQDGVTLLPKEVIHKMVLEECLKIL